MIELWSSLLIKVESVEVVFVDAVNHVIIHTDLVLLDQLA